MANLTTSQFLVWLMRRTADPQYMPTKGLFMTLFVLLNYVLKRVHALPHNKAKLNGENFPFDHFINRYSIIFEC